ncbi:Nitroreductase [Methanobrevibacter olleyae]|uniref:Nitroreductase n=1 Tax=Methanobrevibacter olleyae TaxID=294671 RepID=A0A1I4KDH7_METOL|nr:nitroreductase family protein [Methanobrevibacter olleyae]SFL76780.1 Nitroreductase [Methanobrevibacter olleyae]
MDLLEIMLKRRSLRKYKDEEIPKEKLNKILQAGLLAPTSRNRKPCSFLIVDKKEVLEKLSESKQSSSKFLKNANKAIVVVANTLVSDTWIEDSSIALAFMHLMATEQYIGSCWVQIHLRKSKSNESSEDYVRKVLGIDDYFRIVGILALGVPFHEVQAHKIEDIDKEKVHYLR